MSKWLFLAALAAADTEAPPPDAIVVEIAGLRSDRGAASCALFRSEEGFPSDRGSLSHSG